MGTIVGGAAAGLSRLVALQFEQFDAQVKFKDEISKMGGIGAGTTAELSALAKQAGYSYMDLQKLSKPLQTAREGLQVLGGTVGEGTKSFLEMANVGRETRMQFERLGVSQEELTNMQGQYLQLQRLSGAALRDEAKDKAKLKQSSLEYAENLIKLSALTGKSAEALAQEQQQAQLQFEELVKTRQENAAIARLSRGDATEQAEAQKIKNEQASRKQFINDMTARVGPEMAQQLAKVARTGTYDESTKGLANLGISAQQLSADLKNAKPGKETEDLILRTQTSINEKFDQKAEGLGLALQLGGENLGKDFGITQQALERTTGQQGKTAEELDKIAKDAIAKAKAAGTDKDLDKRGALTEAEISAKKAVDSLAGAMDYTKIATYALAAAAIAAALALAKIGASGLTDMFKKGGGKGKPTAKPRARDAKGRFTKAPPPSRFARATSALGKMTRPLAGLARGVGAAARFIPGAGLIAAGGMAAYDAYSGYKDAGKNLGISGRQATTGEKLSSAAGSALSGLTFGLISPETISKSIAKATGAGPGASSSQDAAKEAQKKHEAQMAATDQSKEKTEASIVTTQSKIETDQKTIDQTKELQEANKLREESTQASYNSLSRALGNAIDKLNIFSTSLQTLATTINGMGGGGGTSPFGPAPDGGGSAPSGAGSAPANLSSYMATTAMLESGGDANARAKTSSAGGMFQFLDGTWKQLTKEMGKNYSLEDKFDPRKAAEVMAYFTEKNKKQLERSTGRPASNTDLYMAHFLGAGGASKFLNAMGRNPNALAADMDPRAARANKNIYYDESGKPRTLKQVYDLMASKYNKQAEVVATGRAPKFVQEMAAAGGMRPGGGEAAGPSGDLAAYFNFRSPSGDETDFRGMNGALQNALMLAAQDYK